MNASGAAIVPLCLCLLALAAPAAPAGELRSGYEYLKPETRAMQEDAFGNPGMLTVERGQQLFNGRADGAGKPCAGCHGKDGAGLDPRAIARYPVYDAQTREIVNLQKRIRRCRRAAGGSAVPGEHPDLIALETFVRHLAFGEPVNVATHGAAAERLAQGERLYRTRYGLIDMACDQCHDIYPGQMLRGQKISQGHGNGFPAYRLDSGEITTLPRRIQQCMTLMRAEPFAGDSEEIDLLGLYIMARSNGLPIETPAVRY